MPAARAQREPDEGLADSVDRLGPRRLEPGRRQAGVEDRRGDPDLDVGALSEAGGGGDPRLRQAHDRDGHPARAGEQQALLGHELAPRVADKAGRQHRPHQGDVGHRLILDAQPGELAGEVGEVLREDAHRRGVDDVLDPPGQRQLQDGCEAAGVGLAHRRVRRHQVKVGGQVVDRVHLAGQPREVLLGQAEQRLADVPGPYPDPLAERVLPDLGGRHPLPDPVQATRRAVRRGPGSARPGWSRSPQQFREHEPPDEPRRAGQEHGREAVRGDRRPGRRGRRQVTDGALQELQVLLALRGKARVRGGRCPLISPERRPPAVSPTLPGAGRRSGRPCR